MGIEDLLAQEHAQQAMGVPPSPEGMPPQGQGPAPQPEPSDKPTAEDIAQKAAAPNTEDKKANVDPILFDVDMGDGKMEQFTPQQIKGMKERYAAMNRDHMEAKPLMDIFKALRERAGNGEKAAQMLMQAIKKNAKMGEKANGESHSEARNEDREQKQSESNDSWEDQLKAWADQNSVEVPPFYKEMMSSNQKLVKQNEMLLQMMQEIRKQGASVNQASQATQQQAQQQNLGAMQQRIQGNLEKAAQAVGVSEDQANDFQTFLAQRGYSIEEMADPELTMTLMKDFASNGNSDELNALKRVMQKRAAHSGSLGATPQQGDAGGNNQPLAPHERLLQARGR